jgi:hypothetical protein
MPQLARLSVKPGIPKIKRRLGTGKRPLETRLGFRGYTPRVGAFIERDDACCFPYLVGKVRYLRGHPKTSPQKGLTAGDARFGDDIMSWVTSEVFHRMPSAKQMQASRANCVGPHLTRQTSDTGLLA